MAVNKAMVWDCQNSAALHFGSPTLGRYVLSMRIGIAQIAGFLAIIYAAVFFGGIFLHYATSGDLGTLTYSLSLPRVWLSLIVAVTVGIGLINRQKWAWWLGLAAVIPQLYGSATRLWNLFSQQGGIPFGMALVFALLSAFLLLLLAPSTKRECH